MTFTNGTLKTLALVALVIDVVGAMALIAVALITNHDLGDPRIAQPLGFAVTIAVTLFGILGLSNKQDVMHKALNGTLQQLVDTSKSDSFQAGQAAGAGAPVPPAVPNNPPQAVPPQQQQPPGGTPV